MKKKYNDMIENCFFEKPLKQNDSLPHVINSTFVIFANLFVFSAQLLLY